jgi:hypothetical protein
MPRWWPFGRSQRWPTQPLDASGSAPVVDWTPRALASIDVTRTSVAPDNLTAAALAVGSVQAGRRRMIPQYEAWQRELWDNYDEMGEFGYAVTWRSNMVSRVRLRAARLVVGSDEPVIADEGPAAELVADLTNDVSSQSDLLASMSTQLDIPGEGWLIGETRDGKNHWQVRSNDELRRAPGHGGYQVIDEASSLGTMDWRDLALDHHVVRIWRPHKRYRHLAYSPAKAARTAMRELELCNRHIQAQYLSRLASAGVVVFPDEITFPVRDEFKDEPDPFVREWIETAAQAIKTPGTAAAVIPIPIRVPGEYIDKIRHVDFTLKIDEKIIEKRDSARRNLASMINVPTELLFDAGSLNHWGLWQLEESAIKIHIAPDVEIIAQGLTRGYLHPMLQAQGVADWEEWVVWYDASEIIARPDRSANVLKLYDRFEASGEALRREVGLTEDDKPTQSELETMVLKKLATNPQIGFVALHELTGLEIPEEVIEQPDTDVVGEHKTDHRSSSDLPNDDRDEGGIGDPSGGRGTDLDDPASVSSSESELDDGRAAFTILQAATQHVIEFGVAGWKLKHPQLCQPRLFSCPFTHATARGVTIHPGTHGDYECTLNAAQQLAIGRRVFVGQNELIPTDPWSERANGATNGHTQA